MSRQRDTESTRASKPRTSDNGRSHSIASNDGGQTRNDNGNSRSGSLDYAASSRGNSIDYPSFSRNSSLDYGNNRYLNHNEGESYSLPYDINISGGKSRSDSCYSDHLDVSKINEEINKLNRTCNELDENAFLKRSNPCEYEAGIDSSPAPRVSDNFNRTYEQVSIQDRYYTLRLLLVLFHCAHCSRMLKMFFRDKYNIVSSLITVSHGKTRR